MMCKLVCVWCSGIYFQGNSCTIMSIFCVLATFPHLEILKSPFWPLFLQQLWTRACVSQRNIWKKEIPNYTAVKRCTMVTDRAAFPVECKTVVFPLLFNRYPRVYGSRDVWREVWWICGCVCLRDVHARDGYLRVPLLWMSKCCSDLQTGY